MFNLTKDSFGPFEFSFLISRDTYTFTSFSIDMSVFGIYNVDNAVNL